MNKAQLEALLVSQNPQWRGEPVLVPTAKRRTMFSRILDTLITQKRIVAVSGPRRTGKSVLIRQVLHALLTSQNVSAKNTMVFQFSPRLNVPEIISEILSMYRTTYADASRPIYIFLDEVQYIEYWQDQIKEVFDLFEQIRFVVTGSTSLWYGQRSSESLAGRVTKLRLPVLSFPEYLDFSGFATPSISLGQDLVLRSEARAVMMNHMPAFEAAFNRYLAGGLMPELAVHPTMPKMPYLNDLLDQILNFDIPYMHTKLDRTLFLNVFRSLAATTGNEFSINRIATDFGADRRTVTEYVLILKEAGFLGVAENAYFRKVRARLSASKKGYMLNPALALASGGFDEQYLGDSRVFGQYAESYAYGRLIDRFSSVSYYRDKRGEIDFLADHIAIEIKTGDAANISRYVNVANRLKRDFVLVSPRVLSTQGNVRWVPLYLL